jgi:creatinine amidohydrolase
MNRPCLFLLLTIIVFLINCKSGFSQSFQLPSVFIEELTWTELDSAFNSGVKTIIIPTGGTAQNGPHMVLGKHNFRVKYLAKEIAIELGDAIIAPTIAYVPEGGIDPPNGWMKFPGTIHLPEEYFIKLLEYASRSFNFHGFTDIILIGDSGGNQNGMKVIAEQLNEEWKDTKTRVHYISKFYTAWTPFEKSLAEEGLDPKYFGSHAGLTDVSSLLAIDQDLLRTDIMKKLGYNDEENRTLGFSGNPSMATVEIGQRLNEAVIIESVEQIIWLKKENRR